MPFVHSIGRRKVTFTVHSLNRWWDRCDSNHVNGRNAALDLLRDKLEESRWSTTLPAWSRLSQWNRARAEGFIYIDPECGFVVIKNPNGDRIAVTFIDYEEILYGRGNYVK